MLKEWVSAIFFNMNTLSPDEWLQFCFISFVAFDDTVCCLVVEKIAVYAI